MSDHRHRRLAMAVFHIPVWVLNTFRRWLDSISGISGNCWMSLFILLLLAENVLSLSRPVYISATLVLDASVRSTPRRYVNENHHRVTGSAQSFDMKYPTGLCFDFPFMLIEFFSLLTLFDVALIRYFYRFHYANQGWQESHYLGEIESFAFDSWYQFRLFFLSDCASTLTVHKIVIYSDFFRRCLSVVVNQPTSVWGHPFNFPIPIRAYMLKDSWWRYRKRLNTSFCLFAF